MKKINTCIVEGKITIIDKEKKRFEIECNDLEIMVYCSSEGTFNCLELKQDVRIVGMVFNGGILAQNIEVRKKINKV